MRHARVFSTIYLAFSNIYISSILFLSFSFLSPLPPPLARHQVQPQAEGGEDSATEKRNGYELDCYPYTFSPLLLFAKEGYFDKGYSNYNSVAQFFASTLGDVDMLSNVLYDRKNMLYEELLAHVTQNCMLVTCCIDAHFTAFQVLPNKSLLYYDPLKSSLFHVSGDSFNTLVGFLLLKCNYGNSQHMTENEVRSACGSERRLHRSTHRLYSQC